MNQILHLRIPLDQLELHLSNHLISYLAGYQIVLEQMFLQMNPHQDPLVLLVLLGLHLQMLLLEQILQLEEQKIHLLFGLLIMH